MLHKILLSLTLALLPGVAIHAAGQSADGYDVDPETGFRMERYRAPVPADVPGGKTLDVPEAMQAQLQGKTTFIDVYPPKGLGPDPLDGHWVITEERRSIPGSIWLPEVGRGTLSSEAEDYFRRNLARLTGADPGASIVFFCTSDCWQSWNAARRAIGWGYTDVHWFPLGTDGWLEAGGELTNVQPVNFLDDSTPTIITSATATPTGLPDKQRKFPDSGRIFLLDQAGSELEIGTVIFSASDAPTTAISVELDSEQFVDQFLSMRPFKCLTDPAEWFCHLPYPYELSQTITPADLTELEYQLLFIWKSPTSFGIDAWNGVYYQLSWQTDGTLKGTLLQGDLNVLADPPEPFSHPINLDEFITEDAQSRLFPSLIIRP